jgi:hypothetical protein
MSEGDISGTPERLSFETYITSVALSHISLNDSSRSDCQVSSFSSYPSFSNRQHACGENDWQLALALMYVQNLRSSTQQVRDWAICFKAKAYSFRFFSRRLYFLKAEAKKECFFAVDA